MFFEDPSFEEVVEKQIKTRRHERFAFFRHARWDFFAGGTGFKTGYVMNISKSGCLLKASEIADHRRWIRIMIQDAHSNVCFAQVGRIVRRQDVMETLSDSTHGGTITLYRYGVEFTHPGYLTDQEDLILALSSNSLTVRSCLTLNSTSSFLPGSLA
ncbi:MAG: PilZ domain-containing protein [Oligoflexia bacterium]|nr:PilZ domain-containing protein [Oligoflexia bacterium]